MQAARIMKWSPEIHAGHLMQASIICVAVALWFFNLDARIKIVEQRTDTILDRMDRDDMTVQRQLDLLLSEIRTLRQEMREIERQRQSQ